MELQLQVTEEELLEFPEVRPDQNTTNHSDKPAGEVVLSKKQMIGSKILLMIGRVFMVPML